MYQKGLVSVRVVSTDMTHAKANTSRASDELVEVVEKASVYWERLDVYEEGELEQLTAQTGK